MIVGYITQQGDRLDSLAYTYIGDPTLYLYIIYQNPFLPIYPNGLWLEKGLTIDIPELSDIQNVISTSSIWD